MAEDELGLFEAHLEAKAVGHAGTTALVKQTTLGPLDLADLARVEGVDVGDETEQLSVQACKRLLSTMVACA